MSRQIVRTLRLSSAVHEAGAELIELEFYEPTSALFDELEAAATWNDRPTTKRKEVIPTGLVVLEHLTRLDGSTLRTLSFDDRRKANEIAAEVMGAKLETGER